MSDMPDGFCSSSASLIPVPSGEYLVCASFAIACSGIGSGGSSLGSGFGSSGPVFGGVGGVSGGVGGVSGNGFGILILPEGVFEYFCGFLMRSFSLRREFVLSPFCIAFGKTGSG